MQKNFNIYVIIFGQQLFGQGGICRGVSLYGQENKKGQKECISVHAMAYICRDHRIIVPEEQLHNRRICHGDKDCEKRGRS